MDIDAAKDEITEEVEKAFDAIEVESKHAADFLGQLQLPPLRRALMRNYSHPGGPGRSRKYRPLSQAKTLMLKDLLDMNSRNKLLRRLRRNQNEAKDLGYNLNNRVPSSQVIYQFITKRIDEQVKTLMDHTVAEIRRLCRERDKLIDVELVDEEGVADDASAATKYRKKTKKMQEACNVLKWKVFPHLGFNRAANAAYDDIEFLDLLLFVAMRNTFTNNGWNIMRDTTEADVPRSQTILKHIRDLDRDTIRDMFDEANEELVNLAKQEGRLDEPVTLLLDFTTIRYYGDKNDEMVREKEPKDGTSHVYEFIVAKAKHGGENYVLGVEPIGKLDDKVEVTGRLLDRVRELVEVERVISDREFSNSRYFQAFEDRGLEYLNLPVRNSVIKRIMEQNDAPHITKIRFGKEQVQTTLVLRRDSNGKVKPFLTNASNLYALGVDLFEDYGERWDIETGFDDIKNKFLPKTTSKDFNVRLFYFLFANLVYNAWTLTNVVVSRYIHGVINDKKLITAKKFLQAIFHAHIDYG